MPTATQPLNAQQQAVIDWIDEDTGSLNLEARAGCGKTYTIVNGVVRHILRTTDQTIALAAYNKSAAEEFKSRLAKLNLLNGRVRAGTVHSFGAGMWRQMAPNAQLNERKVWDIMKPLEQTDATVAQWSSQIRKLVSLAKQQAFGVDSPAEDLGQWYELAAHHDIDCNGSLDMAIEAAIDIFNISLKQVKDVIDFDDMILAPLMFVQNVKRYDWVLIDEAQDTNRARRLLMLKLLKPGGRLVAVGDSRQAIYGFTGADSDSLDLIRNVMNSKVLPLSITYRCPKAVVAEANRLVPDLQAHESAPDGVVRKLPAKSKDGNWFTAENLTADDAALCRNTKQLLEEAYKMIAAGIGCRVEGRDIGEGLVTLATRWRRATTLGILKDNLRDYLQREAAKFSAEKDAARLASLEDKVETLNVIIDHLIGKGANSVNELVAHIRSLFGDTPEGEKPRVFTFSTIHKAKGREWDRVYFLFKASTMPSKYAKQDWQLAQESNLEYVAITRAKKELVYVD